MLTGFFSSKKRPAVNSIVPVPERGGDPPQAAAHAVSPAYPASAIHPVHTCAGVFAKHKLKLM